MSALAVSTGCFLPEYASRRVTSAPDRNTLLKSIATQLTLALLRFCKVSSLMGWRWCVQHPLPPYEYQKPSKGFFCKGGFCRIPCHAQETTRALVPAVHDTQSATARKTSLSWFLRVASLDCGNLEEFAWSVQVFSGLL